MNLHELGGSLVYTVRHCLKKEKGLVITQRSKIKQEKLRIARKPSVKTTQTATKSREMKREKALEKNEIEFLKMKSQR